jgi:hypothetical protein
MKTPKPAWKAALHSRVPTTAEQTIPIGKEGTPITGHATKTVAQTNEDLSSR